MGRVKEAVFPFKKFKGVDILLGPEMKSTGEVMGLDTNFEQAFAKLPDDLIRAYSVGIEKQLNVTIKEK